MLKAFGSSVASQSRLEWRLVLLRLTIEFCRLQKLYRIIIKRNSCNYTQNDDFLKDVFRSDLFSQYFDMYFIAVFNIWKQILSSHVLVRM